MRDPADLDEGLVVEMLNARYGIGAERLVFLPVGNDSASWSYRVETSASSYFLKVRAGAGSMPRATVSGYLGAVGVPQVMAPLPAVDGASYVVVEELALALYPLVEARTAMEAGLTAGEWRRFGEVVSRIHAAPPPAGMRTETFVPDGRELVPELVASLAAPAGAIARELAGLWREHRETIDALLRRTDAAGPRDVPRAPSTAAAGPLGTRTSTRCYPTTVGGAG